MASAVELELAPLPSPPPRASSPALSRTSSYSQKPAMELDALPDSTATLSRISSLSAAAALIADGHAGSQLPPIDGGREAWTFVVAATVQETLVWGFSFSFSVFQDALPNEYPGASPVAISAIGTTALALEYTLLLFLINVYRRYPELVRPFSFAAVGLCTVSLLASSWATSITQLILLQGCAYGIGGGIMYAPCVLYLYEWFSAKRGIAGGCIFACGQSQSVLEFLLITLSGSGIGGFAFPLILGSLLDKVGYSNTLRIWSAVVFVGSGAAMFGLKPRLPLPPKGAPRASMIPRDLGWTLDPVFWTVTLTFILQSLGFLAVSLYMAPFVSSLGLAPVFGQVALSIFNVAGVVGQIGVGWLSDRRPYTHVMAVLATLSAIIAFALWGFANSLALVLTFAVAFGAVGGGFSSTWPIAATDIAGKQSHHAGLVFACFAVGKAVAAIAGPSIAGSLHDPTTVRSTYGQAGFQKMTIFVGSTMVCAGAGSVLTQVVRRRRKF